jgi:hypothetical protein
MMEMKTDASPFADTAAVRVCLQMALPPRISWIDAVHVKFTIGMGPRPMPALRSE